MTHMSETQAGDILCGKHTDFDVTTATVACGAGYLDVVRYLHAHGCELDDTCAIYAAGSGYVTILEFLRDKVPFEHRNIWTVAHREGQTDVLDWLQIAYMTRDAQIRADSSWLTAWK